MAHEFRTRRRIEFADTDMAGIVHFSRFYVFMEQAEQEFLRSLGLTVHGGKDSEGNGSVGRGRPHRARFWRQP